MKILYLITGLGIGGAEVVTINLANRMQRQGHAVKLVYMTGKNLMKQCIESDIQIENLHIKKNPLTVIRSFFILKKILENFQPDIVHANMVHANVFARIARLFFNIPKLVCTAHNKNEGGFLRMLLYRLTDTLSDLNTNVSEEALDAFIEKKAFSKEKSVCVYNGISLFSFKKDVELRERCRKENGINKNDFIYISVGRLTEAKDFSNLINAFKIVSEKHTTAKLFIVGEGAARKSLELLIKTLGLNEKACLLGSQSNVLPFYNMSDCFVLSSAWEGFGIVLAEAMACELPVVTTDAGGCAEVVAQPQWVVPIKNSEMLAEKMSSVIELNTIQRSELGENNREIVTKFDIEKIVENWVLLYKKLLNL